MKNPHPKGRRLLKLIAMALIIAVVILFIIHTSEDIRWGGGYWEHWLGLKFRFSFQQAHTTVFWIRKIIHFIGYGTLGLFLWYYFACLRFKKAFISGIISATLIAVLDEYMQSRTTFRTGQPSDVVLDFTGILCFMAVANALSVAKKSRAIQ